MSDDIDLVGMTVGELRAKAKVTVLERADGKNWPPDEVFKICQATNNPASGHPHYPQFMILPDEQKKDVIAAAIGHENFSLRVVQGMDNPVLPFKPQF